MSRLSLALAAKRHWSRDVTQQEWRASADVPNSITVIFVQAAKSIQSTRAFRIYGDKTRWLERTRCPGVTIILGWPVFSHQQIKKKWWSVFQVAHPSHEEDCMYCASVANPDPEASHVEKEGMPSFCTSCCKNLSVSYPALFNVATVKIRSSKRQYKFDHTQFFIISKTEKCRIIAS
jgi:hypothetical protein